MANEDRDNELTRPPSSYATRLESEGYYMPASQNLWVKALSLIGIGIILLLAYAVLPEVALLIIGVCVIMLGVVLIVVDHVVNKKCKRSSGGGEHDGDRIGDRDRSRGQRRPYGDLSRSRSRYNHGRGEPLGDIWTCYVPTDWEYPPTPPPVYTPTAPTSTVLQLTLDIRDIHNDRHSDPAISENDSVPELPGIFPMRTRRRCLSAPPLPSYEEVIEEDVRRVRSSSTLSLPAVGPPSPPYADGSTSDSVDGRPAVSQAAVSPEDAGSSGGGVPLTTDAATPASPPEQTSRTRATSVP